MKTEINWVSVDSGLPDNSNNILVHLECGQTFMAKYDTKRNKFTLGTRSNLVGVTHWALIPCPNVLL